MDKHHPIELSNRGHSTTRPKLAEETGKAHDVYKISQVCTSFPGCV